MNTEQERAAFEAWLRIKPCGAAHDLAWEAWQARAALQSAEQQPAPDVSALVEALRVLVDNGGIGPESMFDDARAALAAHRKPGGES